MNILENAKKHFAQRQELRGPIEVPEWGDESGPLQVYYKAPNMKTRDEMTRALNDGGVGGVVIVLILMALDANGKPLFVKAQKPELMRSVDPLVIERITGEMDVRTPDPGES